MPDKSSQPDLFSQSRAAVADPLPITPLHRLTHRNDPSTSRRAAVNVKHFERGHKREILKALLRGAGTIYQIAARSSLDHVQVARMMKTMQECGVVIDTGIERPGKTGNLCRVWEITQFGESLVS